MKNQKKFYREECALHIVEQYLFEPSSQTFKDVFILVSWIVEVARESFCEEHRITVEIEPIIGYVISRLYKCKEPVWKFIGLEAISFLKKLHKFEEEYGV
jgi:hypothetical protein